MKMKEISEIETPKLQERLAELRDKVRELRFGLMNRQVKNVREIRALRRDIARISTVVKQRQSENT